jgi:hypothetical protein
MEIAFGGNCLTKYYVIMLENNEKKEKEMATPMILGLPMLFMYGDNGFLVETDYWNTEICEKGFYFLVYNMDKYFLLLPENKNGLLNEVVTAQSVVITKGSYKGKNNWFEIMFEDNTDNPYMIMLEDEQFLRASPLKEGWNGQLYIYSDSLSKYKCNLDKVYYRVTDNLPCLKPVEV